MLAALGHLIAVRAQRSNDRLVSLEKELDIARQIQASILPAHMPVTERLRIASRYLPMTAVAGDFFDFLHTDEHRLGILIADVSGHGVPAALIASMVKVAISAQSAHADDPARVLAGINETLCGKLKSQFVTAAYLFIDMELGMMRYSAAGHPAMLWCSNSGTDVRAIEENGLVLGLMSSAEYKTVEHSLQSGDRMLLYTDGLLEASNRSDEFFGEERVRQVLMHNRSRTGEESVDALLQSVQVWSGAGTDPEDDLTLIIADVI